MADNNAAPQTFATLPVAGKLLILVLIVGVISGLYYVLAYMPLSEDITRAQRTNTTKQEELREARERQRQFALLTQQIELRRDIDQQNRRVLPEDAEIAAFLENLDTTAELAGLSINQVTPRTEEPGEFYTSIPVDLVLRGRYFQLAKFFHTISTLDRAISMEEISITLENRSGQSDGAAEPVVDIRVRAMTYKRPPPQTAPPGATPEPEGRQ